MIHLNWGHSQPAVEVDSDRDVKLAISSFAHLKGLTSDNLFCYSKRLVKPELHFADEISLRVFLVS